MATRLTPKHPLYEKLEKVFQLMNELEIVIEFGSFRTEVRDRETEAYLKDQDNGSQADTLPGMFEYDLILAENES